MSASRVPLDLEQPLIVACSELPCGPRVYKRGDLLAWREAGLTELDVLRLWQCNQVDTKLSQPVVAPPPAPKSKPPTSARR